MHRLEPPEVLERQREERIRVPVVERDVGRRAQDDERSLRVDLPLLERPRVGLEVGEVVLLLEARVLEEFRRRGAVAGEPVDRDRVGHDDLRRGAAAELVLRPRPLVVEGGRARDPEPSRGHRQLVRAVRERDVEVASARPASQRAQPRGHLPRLAEPRAAAVMPDRRRGHAVALDQLQGLRVVARGDLDLVAARLEQLDERPEDERMRARRHVDPDAHQRSPADDVRERARRGCMPSTWRSCQSVNASRPQSWRERSSRPATWSSSTRATASGCR